MKFNSYYLNITFNSDWVRRSPCEHWSLQVVPDWVSVVPDVPGRFRGSFKHWNGRTKSYGLTSGSTGVLLSAFFWGYVITRVPGGWVAVKYSVKRVLIGALVAWGTMAILTVPFFNSLLAVRFIMGLAEGVVWPSFAVMFVNWFPEDERARAINFSEMPLPISSLIMAPLAGWMILTWNYHVMFILQGLPPLIMAVIFGLLGSYSPEKDSLISESERTFLAEHRSTAVKETGYV
jgi:MFS family permease